MIAAAGSRAPTIVAATLLGAALVAWIAAAAGMETEAKGPNTDLGSLGWYVGFWVTMTAAMMLPSVAPMVLLFARVTAERARRGRAVVPTWIFVAGYLSVWTLVGVGAYTLQALVRVVDGDLLAWSGGGRLIAAGAVAAAAAYQVTPLKEVCLRHCRGPMHLVLGAWRNGRRGALRMGAAHGLYCVGCCAGLMLVLFAIGVMSLVWMAVVAALVFAEKVLPRGERLRGPLAVALLALAVWIAVAPATVPALAAPGLE